MRSSRGSRLRVRGSRFGRLANRVIADENCRLDYGTDGLDVDLPDERVTVIEPVFRAAVAESARGAASQALRAPIGRPPLRDIVRPGQQIAISVCDITRRAAARRDAPRALRGDAGHPPDDVTILIATGTHRTNTPAELERMLGPDIVAPLHRRQSRQPRRRVARARRRDENRRADLPEQEMARRRRPDHDRLRRAALLRRLQRRRPRWWRPGLAGLKTVLVLHDAKRIGSPNATWGVIEGNPIQDDVREIARMTGVTFSIDVTLNRDQQITAVFAGELFAEHGQACAAAKGSVMRAVDAPFDVVLTTNSGYPLDQNLYQAVKGMSAAAKVVKPGGTIICAAECRDGLPNHGSYGEVLASRPSPQALLEMIQRAGLRACPMPGRCRFRRRSR